MADRPLQEQEMSREESRAGETSRRRVEAGSRRGPLCPEEAGVGVFRTAS